MSNGNGNSSPPDGGFARDAFDDPNATIEPFTPERVQSILTARNEHPYSFLSLFYSDPAKTHMSVIARNLESFQTQVLKSRPLRDDEVAALADHWGASANVALSSKPAALALTFFMAWRGRARFRFPWWQPKWVNTSPDAFPTINQALLWGKPALFAWHAARVVSYGVICNWLVTPFFLSYAGVRATVSISSDPRLQDAIKESVKDIKSQKRINEMQRRTGKAPTEVPSNAQGGQPGRSTGGDVPTQDWGNDDASPQSGSNQGSDAKWNAPPQTPQTPQIPQTPQSYGSRPQRQPPPPPPTSENSGWGDDSLLEELDDASPRAPAPRPQDTPRRGYEKPTRAKPPPPSQDGVSAWDRLREQNNSDGSDDSNK